MSTDPVTDMLTGVAELLAAAGVGSWNPTTVVALSPTVPAIGVTATPPDAPLSITLNNYTVDQSAKLTDRVEGLNVRIRGDRRPNTAKHIAHQVWLALHALGRRTLGTVPDQVPVVDVFWQSEAEIGPDQNGRFERSINYYVRMNLAHPRLE